jgi:hypothetical protein
MMVSLYNTLVLDIDETESRECPRRYMTTPSVPVLLVTVSDPSATKIEIDMCLYPVL